MYNVHLILYDPAADERRDNRDDAGEEVRYTDQRRAEVGRYVYEDKL